MKKIIRIPAISHRLSIPSRLGLGMVALAAWALASPVQSAVVLSQPLDTSATPYLSGSFANTDANQYVYDTFKLTNAETLTSLNWQGTDAGGAQFTLRFYDTQPSTPDSGGGNPSKSYLNVTPDVTQAAGGFFSYAYALPTSFAASAGTQYWLSVVAINSSWLWAGDGAGTPNCTGSTVPPCSTFYTFGNSLWTGLADYRALTLNNANSSPVPEPSSIALLLLGGILLRRFSMSSKV
jgi:hypothetical protein